jgi:mannan endo-1,4-beta-mannosidase
MGQIAECRKAFVVTSFDDMPSGAGDGHTKIAVQRFCRGLHTENMTNQPCSLRRAGQVLSLVMVVVLGISEAARAVDALVTPGASAEAQSLLPYFADIYGKNILSGQHEGWHGANELGSDLNHIKTQTGKLPAVLSIDVASYIRPRQIARHEMVGHVVDWYSNRNGIVSICWHWNAPMNGRAFYTKETTFNPARGATKGTPEYEALLKDIDAVAGELKLLQEAHVPVMWRPFHEANGRWFWWGAQGPEPFKQLWRIMFDRLVNEHHLNNLIWVFSPGASIDLADWYPGDEYVDIIGQDHYPMDNNNGPAKDIFDELVALTAGNKLVALSENGPIPDPDRLVSEKAGWLFFTTWSGQTLVEKNTPEQLKKAYNHAYVLNLGDLGDFKRHAFKPSSVAAKLEFPAVPSDVAIGGLRRRPVTVAVQDAQGVTVRTNNIKVTLALGANLTGSKLTGTLVAPTVNGIATFPDVRIDKAGRYTFEATAEELRGATSPEFEVGPGSGIARQARDSVGGTSQPATSVLITKAFETPVAMATNFIAEFRGYLLPPIAGEYRLWIANDGVSELWLSTDETPANKVKLTEIIAGTPYSKWPHTHEAGSRPVKLEPGKRYYLEVKQKQAAGSAHLSVRWQLPNGIEERPIPGSRLAPLDGIASGTKSSQAETNSQ